MKKNLNSKIALIVAVLLVCLYGIFGIPSGFSGKALMDAMTKRIHLGLDLRGGAHLILAGGGLGGGQRRDRQHGGRDPAGSEEGAPDLFPGLQARSGQAGGDPHRGRAAGQCHARCARSLDAKYSNEYDVIGRRGQHLHADHEANVQSALEKKTVQQAIETIRDRVDSLGVSEPVIQEYGLGANQILVELPGIDDLDRVKSIIQSTARLEIHAVVGRSVSGRAGGAGQRGRRSARRRDAGPWLRGHGHGFRFGQRVCSAADLAWWPAATSAPPIPSTNQNTGQRIVSFTLTNEAGDKFYDYTSANVGHSMAVVMGGRVREVATIKSAIRDRGEIEGTFTEDEVDDPLQDAAHRRAAGLAELP